MAGRTSPVSRALSAALGVLLVMGVSNPATGRAASKVTPTPFESACTAFLG